MMILTGNSSLELEELNRSENVWAKKGNPYRGMMTAKGISYNHTHLSPDLKCTARARRPLPPTTLTLFMRKYCGHVSMSMRASMMVR